MVAPAFGDGGVDLALALLQPESDFQLLLDREVLEVECLAGPDADAGELCPDLSLIRRRGRKLQRKVEIFEEVPFREFLGDLRKKLIVGAAGGAGCFR